MGRINGPAAWILVTGWVAGIVACGGGSSRPDFGFEDAVEETASDPGAGEDVLPGDVSEATETFVDPGTGAEVVGPVPCVRDEDCKDAPVELGECQKKVCLKPQNVCGWGWQGNCCRAETFLQDGFEGDLRNWTIDDPRPDDEVSWVITDHRKALGSRSLYVGNPRCRIYDNGQRDADCRKVGSGPGTSSPVRLSIQSPAFSIPPLDTARSLWFLSVRVFQRLEPAVAGRHPDALRVLVIENPKDTAIEHPVFSSDDLPEAAETDFVLVTANLREFAGKEIAIRFLFETADALENDFEGVYLDDLRVESRCDAECTPGTSCADDDDTCSDNRCQAMVGSESQGVCSYPAIPWCLQPECTPETVATDCPPPGTCQKAVCVDWRCGVEDLPPDQCCESLTIFEAGFDGGLDGFQVWAYQDNQKVRWQPSTARSTSGTGSLYYGNLASRTYDNAGGITFGEATSPRFEVPAEGFTFLTYQLFLQTEWDDVQGDYYNPLGQDFFETQVVTDGAVPGQEEVRDVWTSHIVRGTTRGAFQPVGVDLTPFAGKTVSIRFRFDTGNPDRNAYEGVYVDDLRVTRNGCRRQNCASAADCLVDGVCRSGRCDAGVCQVNRIGPEGCCTVQTECDDQDACTLDGCLANQCRHDVFESPSCCVPTVAARFPFEDPDALRDFLVTDQSVPGAGGPQVTWVRSLAKAAGGEASLRYGNETSNNYDNFGIARGSILTPPVTVPAAGQVRLSFSLFLDIEESPDLDRFWVEVVEGDAATEVFQKNELSGGNYDQWYAVPPIDLAPWRGRTVRLRFQFDSVDAQENRGQGVFVDDIEVAKVCP